MGITISAVHLAGILNSRADFLSRLESTHEWKLHSNLFRQLDQLWGPHTVDRFAASHNAQLEVFNSLYWDPKTSAIDTMAQNWVGENNFVNPPFCLTPRILQLVEKQGVMATLIAPWWPAQPWFCQLLEMCIATPFRLPNNWRTFLRIHSSPEPWKNLGWQVYAWRICGNTNWKNKDGQQRVDHVSLQYGHLQH